jgi:diacylglycerol kinase (ATP)
MKKDSRTGWRRIWDAVGFSIKGLSAAWRNETAFRQELCLVLLMLPAAFWIGTTLTERALLVFSLLLVLIVELLNSAIETIVDRIGTERNDLSGRAKDIGSAAVLVSLITAGIIWGVMAWGAVFG